MAGVFSSNEMISMAVQTEQTGYAFYTQAAAEARSPEVRKLLEWLADQERLHERTFTAMLGEESSHRPSEEYAGQKTQYVQTLLDARVLPDPDAGKKALAAMTDDRQAVDFALGFEKDTILFMYEMRDLVTPAQTEAVDRLIAEEKTHVQRLNQVKAQLG